jgi:ABC-2 type transport system ATP-binding protein
MKNSGLMIQAIDLRRNFIDIEAVSGVSFRVHHGETFGLLGPNGAGKTTTIRCSAARSTRIGAGPRLPAAT